MADNLTPPFTGTGQVGLPVKTEDNSGIHAQWVIPAWGPAGTFNRPDTASGKPFPVQLRSATGLIPGGEPTDAAATATDTTSVSWTSLLKQISKSIQLMVFGAGTAAAAQRTTLASDDPAVATLGATTGAAVVTDANGTIQQYLRGLIKQWIAGTLVLGTGANVIGQFFGAAATVSVTVTRAANTTTYAVGDNFGSTSSGGYTLTNAARISGGSGIITDVTIVFDEDAATPLQGEIELFDSSFTEVADNAAFVVSDAEARTLVASIPFTLADFGNNGAVHIQNLNIGFATSGSANLRMAVVAKNAYVPTTNSSVLTARFKIIQTT
jgi:hypothetical protein